MTCCWATSVLPVRKTDLDAGKWRGRHFMFYYTPSNTKMKYRKINVDTLYALEVKIVGRYMNLTW